MRSSTDHWPLRAGSTEPALWLPREDDWEIVPRGESGAVVRRCVDGSRYAKQVGPRDVAELEAERDRLLWLRDAGAEVPRVLEWNRAAGGGRVLISSTLRGVPADALDGRELRVAWPSIVTAVRRLHELDASDCPFAAGVQQRFAWAEDVVARGAVTPGFLPVHQQTTPPSQLLEALRPRREHLLALEVGSAVVTHGDLTLANLMVVPEQLSVTGFLDVGRAGIADRHVDLALLVESARRTWARPEDSRESGALLEEALEITLDPERLRDYLHLDPLTWG